MLGMYQHTDCVLGTQWAASTPFPAPAGALPSLQVLLKPWACALDRRPWSLTLCGGAVSGGCSCIQEGDCVPGSLGLSVKRQDHGTCKRHCVPVFLQQDANSLFQAPTLE